MYRWDFRKYALVPLLMSFYGSQISARKLLTTIASSALFMHKTKDRIFFF